MSIKRKINRAKEWQQMPSEARRYGARHPNIDEEAVKASVLHACHTTGKRYVFCSTDSGGSISKSSAFARLSAY